MLRAKGRSEFIQIGAEKNLRMFVQMDTSVHKLTASLKILFPAP